MESHHYRISIAGHLGRLARDAFGGMEIVCANGRTDLYGEFDQAVLFALLVRVQTLALELVAVRREELTDRPTVPPARGQAAREAAVVGSRPH